MVTEKETIQSVTEGSLLGYDEAKAEEIIEKRNQLDRLDSALYMEAVRHIRPVLINLFYICECEPALHLLNCIQSKADPKYEVILFNTITEDLSGLFGRFRAENIRSEVLSKTDLKLEDWYKQNVRNKLARVYFRHNNRTEIIQKFDQMMDRLSFDANETKEAARVVAAEEA